MTTKTYLGPEAVDMMGHLDAIRAKGLAEELNQLPTLENVAAKTTLIPMAGLPEGYRAIALPSGYLCVYRKLTDIELKELGEEAVNDGYLVAAIVAPGVEAMEPLAAEA